MGSCNTCGNARNECECKDRAIALVNGLLEKPDPELFRSFHKMRPRFSNREWGEMFIAGLRGRGNTLARNDHEESADRS